MYDTKIQIVSLTKERDEYNEQVDAFLPVDTIYAQKTENGGRENMFASRIVHENEVVFTIRYHAMIKVGMYILWDDKKEKIISVHEEGRHRFMHLKVRLSDAQD